MIPHQNMKMLQWGMYQSPEEKGKDYDKSAVRALLLQAIAKEGLTEVLECSDIPGEGQNVPTKIKRFEYKQNDGLFEIIKERHTKKNGTYTNWIEVSKEKVTDNPKEIVDILFGQNTYDPDDLLSVRDVWNAFMLSNYWKDKTIRKNIQSDFEKKMNVFNIEKTKYINFNESKTMIKEDDNEKQDSKDRVAVIITDGEKVIVGQTPQRLNKGLEGNCDLPKGHALVGEDLEEAAKREVYEEIGLRLSSMTKITGQLKYLKGTTLTFFVAYMNPLPKASSLTCHSFYEYNGKEYPEIAAYHRVPLEDLEIYLYKGLAKLIVDNDVKEKAMNTNLKNLNEDFGDPIMTVEEFCHAWNLSKEQGAILMYVLDVYDWDEITFNQDELIQAMDQAKADPDSGWYLDFNESKIDASKFSDMIVESILSEEKHKQSKKK